MCAETTGDRAKLRLTRGSVYLCHARADGNGAKTVSLARFGDYDVRLVEFVRARPTDPTPMWLELYSHADSIRDRQLLLLRPRRGRACHRGLYFARKGVGRGIAGKE